MKMTHESDVLKLEHPKLLAILGELRSFLDLAVQTGIAAHQVEHAVWLSMLRLGRLFFGDFLERLGTGDQGPSITSPDGQSCTRLKDLHQRRYISIFGEFLLQRTAYGSREGQKLDFVPLDNRLQLPESLFSYLLQDWDQHLCVEEAFAKAGGTLARILGLHQSVDSLERMNVQMAKQVEAFRAARELPAGEEEGAIVVSSADGKGVVMRREEGEAAAKAHRTKGDKASRKEMAIVGAVYTVDRHVRTPQEVVAALFRDDRDEPKRDRPEPCHKQVIANLTHTDQDGTQSVDP
jgi:hypothetical protein